jgi:hypothetical protein
LESLVTQLTDNALIGVDLGDGYRKVRLQNRDKNKGKSSGYRVITFVIEQTDDGDEIYLVTVWDKSEDDSISVAEIETLSRETIEKEV